MRKFKINDYVREIGETKKMKVIGYLGENSVQCLYEGKEGDPYITYQRNESVLMKWDQEDPKLKKERREGPIPSHPSPNVTKEEESPKPQKGNICPKEYSPNRFLKGNIGPKEQSQKFNKGDIVNHKSGGDKMVVMGYTNSKVNCSWMDGYRYITKDFFEFELELNTIPSYGIFIPPESVK